MSSQPDVSATPYDTYLASNKVEYIIGIDEVGLGAIAGPILLAAAVYTPGFSDFRIRDSKKITTERARKNALKVVSSTCKDLFYVEIWPTEIAEVGVSGAMDSALSFLAHQAIREYPDSILVLDGLRRVPGIDHPQLVFPQADVLVTAVSAASIAAKVYRDDLMHELAPGYPEFEWNKNKGYPTQEHVQTLNKFGVTKLHRRNVSIVKDVLSRKGEYAGNESQAA